MADNEINHAQQELVGLFDNIKNYYYEELWNLIAGPLCDLPKLNEKVYYFPQGHIEQLEKYLEEEYQMKPIFDLPSKLLCDVISVQLEVEKDTDEIYAKFVLLPDTNQTRSSNPIGNKRRPKVNSFTKVLTASDTSSCGLSIPRRHATECLPPLDMSQPTPTQEIVAKDLHGNEWIFKHTFRGNPRRHLFTTGWSTFVTKNRLMVGDTFVYLRGQNGESLIGIRRAAHQQGHMHSSIISKQSMQHGILASAFNAINSHSMFIVLYKPRSSQFIVSYNKFVDAVNNKVNVGSKCCMSFEGEDFIEKRYFGTVVGISNFSPHWKNSEWRTVEVQWDESALIIRPNNVSSWEVEQLVPSSNVIQSTLLNNTSLCQVNEIGSTSSNLWTSTSARDQEIGKISMNTIFSVPQLNIREANEDSKTPCGWITSHPISSLYVPNDNNQMTLVKEKITIDATNATTSCRLFGVDLKNPLEKKDHTRPLELLQNSLITPTKVPNKKINSIRSRTKVHMQGVTIGRTLDLTVLEGYNQLIDELDKLFDLKDELQTNNQWEIVFIDDEGDMMLIGDDPWPEFCNMVKKIFIRSKGWR